ncbi:MAG: molybdopterin molybdotransferase MoeA, partial [Desulfurococcales archaeon]|nr:molybdopterin molybdotransferase MoeA [Desulfurococcales archaeon]
IPVFLYQIGLFTKWVFELMGIESVKEKLYKYIDPREAINILLNGVSRTSTEVIDVRHALYRVLAEDIISPVDRPWTHLSHVDGYAVISNDTINASSHKPVSLKLVRGIDPRNAWMYKIRYGEAVFVETGYPIPDGADAVVPVEAVRETGDNILVYRRYMKWENIIRKASDVKKNEVIAHKGSRITPGTQKLLIDLGVGDIKVYEKPRVSIIATGDEVVDQVTPHSTSKIPASSLYLLKNIVKYYGGVVEYTLIVNDDPSHLIDTINSIVNKVDIIVTIGGVSMGPKDFTWISLYKHYRPKYYIRGLRIHPGRSTSGMVIYGKPVINLPGLPQSTIAGSIFLLIPILNWLQGLEPCIKIPYIEAWSKEQVVIEKYYGFHRIRYVFIDSKDLSVKIMAKFDSYHVSPIAKTDGLVIIPPNKKIIEAGEKVRVYFFKPIHQYSFYEELP